MKYKVYDPSRDEDQCGDDDVGSLRSRVQGKDAAIGRLAATALEDLCDGRACGSVRRALEKFVAGDASAAATRARIITIYRENLPRDVPVESAIERLYSA